MGLSLSTKHLCAGTYLDNQFAQRVLLKAYGERSRYVAPSYGFDVSQVAYHARHSWWIDILQHALVLAATVVLAFSSLVSVVVAGCLLVVWHSALEFGRLLQDFTRYLRDRRSRSELTRLGVKLWLVVLKLGGTIVAATLTLIGALGISAVSSIWRAEGDHSSIVRVATTAAQLLLLTLGAVLIGALLRQAALHRLLSRSTCGRLNSRMKRMYKEQSSRITLYSGYRPFIGSGEEISTWSFALRLLSRDPSGLQLNGQPAFERKQELPAINFGTEMLVRRIRDELTALAPTTDQETAESELKLPGLVVTDRVFVGETHAGEMAPNVDDAVEQIRKDPTGPARHYLACTVEAWDGEVVTSVFVTASLQGKMLYLEFSVWALLPTRPDFHVSGKNGVQPRHGT